MTSIAVSKENYTTKKTGRTFPAFVVKLPGRVDRGLFGELVKLAKKLNGWHMDGFWFFEEEPAIQFAAQVGPMLAQASFSPHIEPTPRASTPDTTPQPAIPNKLREWSNKAKQEAHGLRNSGTSKQNPTRRRMGILQQQRAEAEKKDLMEKIFAGLAQDHETGTVPKSLQGLVYKSHIEAVALGYYKSSIGKKAGLYDENAWSQAKALLRAYGLPKTDADRLALEQEEQRKRIERMEMALVGRKIPGFFPTPESVIDMMLAFANIGDKHVVLEPSAGKGDIAEAIWRQHPTVELHCVEQNYELQQLCAAKGLPCALGDFLQHGSSGLVYDRVVMNPPFEHGMDIDHVRHAYSLLKPGGKLVAIMCSGSFFRSHKKETQWQEDFAAMEVAGTARRFPLPDGSFKSSFVPTGVNTVLVVMEK